MKSVYNFVVTPVKSRYNNTKDIGGKELIVNTEIFNHQYVSREAIVKSIPTVGDTDIKIGDKVIVHHNVLEDGTISTVQKRIVEVILMKKHTQYNQIKYSYTKIPNGKRKKDIVLQRQ